MKMKNEMKHTIATLARSKTHIRPENEEKTKEERVMKKIGWSLLLNLEADNAKIVQLETEPIVV
jgi:hypothetical protein